MHHLRMPWKKARQMDGRFGKENKPLAIVRVVDAVLSVERWPIVIAWLFDKINRHAGTVRQRPNVGTLAKRAEWQIHIPQKCGEAWKFFANSAVERSDNSDLVPCPAQRLAECADHIREPSTFGIRMQFACRQ